MTKKILAVSFLLFIAWCGIAFSETCYSVDGTVNTINLSEDVQQGIIKLRLFDEYGDAFNETGYIVGMVTDKSTQYLTYLTHTAIFQDGSMFVTDGDAAYCTGIKEYGENGSPCALYVHEEITHIVKGKGFFKKVSDAGVAADGDINICEGVNGFRLTGEICFK